MLKAYHGNTFFFKSLFFYLISNNFSVNTSLEDNTFKISLQEAKDTVNQTPEYAAPQPLDPIGKLLNNFACFYCHKIIFFL